MEGVWTRIEFQNVSLCLHRVTQQFLHTDLESNPIFGEIVICEQSRAHKHPNLTLNNQVRISSEFQVFSPIESGMDPNTE